MSILSKRAILADTSFAAVRDFYVSSRYARQRTDPDTCDFTFGNPHEMPLPGIVSAIRERALPQDKNWFAYKTSEEEPQAFSPSTSGGSWAWPSSRPTSRSPRALSAPSWWRSACARRRRRGGLLRAGLVLLRADAACRRCGAAQGRPEGAGLRSRSRRDRGGDRPADAARHRQHAAQSDRAHLRPRDAARQLAELLERASARIGHRIFLLSDEPYRRLRFDGAGSSARRPSIPGRSSPTATARCCSPPASGSAIWRSRR